jgi:ribosome biogenesis GTPase A
LKGGEPDIKTVSKIVILDWQRGEIPYYNTPPDYTLEKPPKDEELD